MATERKEKLIRVLQILETTDKKTPINATSIVEKLENEYNVGKVDRRSIYRDIAMLICSRCWHLRALKTA